MKLRYLLIVILSLATGLVSVAQDRDETRFIQAVQEYSSGGYERAAAAFEAILKADPSQDAAWFYLGLCRMSRQDIAGAKEAFGKAAELDPKNYWYRDRLARTYALSGDRDQTILQYERLLADFPGQSDIQFNLINLYMAAGQTEKALGALDAVEGTMGKTDASVMTRFELYRRQNDNENAYKALRDYVDEYSSPYVLTILGDYEVGMYNDSTALTYYNQALALDKDYAPARLGIAEAYRMTRRYPEYFSALGGIVSDTDIDPLAKVDYLQALLSHTDRRFQQTYMSQLDSAFDKTLAAHPTDTTVLQLSGSWFAVSGRPERAADMFRKNMELAPQSLPAAATYVQLPADLGNWDEIIRVTEDSYARFPQEPAFLELQNVAFYNKKDYRALLDNCDRIIRIAAGDSARTLSALSSKGDAYWTLGDRKNAFKTYDKALKINPNFAPVLNNYAWYISQSGGNLKKAYKMSKITVELEPDNATYLDTFGWILHLMGKDLEAKPFFKHAMLYGGKDSKTILQHYARVLEKLGETDLATSYRMQADQLPDESDE